MPSIIKEPVVTEAKEPCMRAVVVHGEAKEPVAKEADVKTWI